MKNFIAKRLKPLLFITIFVTAIASSIQYFDVLQRLEYIAYDWQLTLARQNKTPPQDIKIVLVDDASVQAMDPIVGRWPWPRSVFADVIDFLAKGKPKAIIFDILFSENETEVQANSSDARFIQATRDAGNVHHAMLFMNDDSIAPQAAFPLPTAIARLGATSLNAASVRQPSFILSHRNEPRPVYNNFLAPIDGLYQASAGIGVVTVEKDADGVLRRMTPFFQYQDQYFRALSTAPLYMADSQPEMRRSIPLTAQGELLVNQYPFESYSMSAVLAAKAKMDAGEVENLPLYPDEFSNKYIFIGASALGLHDLKTTPLMKNVPGVYMHASVLGNFLENDFLAPTNDIVTYISIVLATLFTTLVVLTSKRIVVQFAMPLLIAVAYFGIAVWQFQHNQVMAMVTPSLGIILAWAACYSFLLFTEEKEKNKIRKMFSQYVSPAALTAMVDDFENYAKAGNGSKETITVLFSDVRGFTSLSENLPPEQVVEILNFYFTKMTEAVHNHHGTIDKFIGDAIMAVWGAPIKSDTHAIDAVNAAKEMMEKLKEVNAWLDEQNLPPLRIGIGVNTGEAVIGSVGSEQKADYTVIGDTVNLASRLEGVTKQYDCEIIVSESTKKALNDRVPCHVVDMIKVKGKEQAIKIYSPILAEKEESQAALTKTYELHCLSELSHEAFSHYLNKRWDLAISAYRKIPNENLRKKFINRCEQFREAPPPQDWDGATTLIAK
ncbi:MAG: adenylate/guanylate cyclase domain-containing protein [Gammaproteobacteria bacterium]|jgi:adenylate cyclase